MNKNSVCFLLFLLFLCTGCEGIKGKLKLVEGNFYYSRGMINEAIGAYLEAANDKTTAAYANYAIGATYLMLEQTDAALERFGLAEQELSVYAENLALTYRIRYNIGIAYFEKGDYKKAADGFRSALQADSSAREAKRNFELSLISLYLKSQSSDITNAETGTIGASQNDQGELIFDYVRQKETDRWKSWEWAGENEETGPDY